MNEAEKFLKACEKYNLKLQINNNEVISIIGEKKLVKQAQHSLDNSKELKKQVIELLSRCTTFKQQDIDAIIDEAVRTCPHSKLNRVENFKSFMCECAMRDVKIFADFDSAGRVFVFLSDKDLELRLNQDGQLEADILEAMAKDVPEINNFLKNHSALENIERRKAIPADLEPELQKFKNECAKYNISIVAGYDDFYRTTPRVFLAVPDYRNYDTMSKLQEYLQSWPELERALYFEVRP